MKVCSFCNKENEDHLHTCRFCGSKIAETPPKDKDLKILGVPNRWFFALTNSVLCVIVEIVLNALGALVWEYNFWNFPNVILIFLIGYLPFMAVSFWVHDMTSRRRQLTVLAVIFGVDIIGIAVFMGVLHWI